MRKTMRRKRRKNTNPRAIQVLAASAAIAAGTQAYAEPVRFDNPASGETGHFDWSGSPGDSTRWLDLTLPAESQPGEPELLTSLRQTIEAGGNSYVRGASGGAGASVEVGGFYDYFLTAVEGGEVIPSGAPWDFVGTTYYPGYGSELPEGQAVYLGVRFDLGGGNQYGWVGVVRTGIELDAFAWAYETEPGVPIEAGIPEPGTLAALALGAAVVGLARRRS